MRDPPTLGCNQEELRLGARWGLWTSSGSCSSLLRSFPWAGQTSALLVATVRVEGGHGTCAESFISLPFGVGLLVFSHDTCTPFPRNLDSLCPC